MALIKCSECTQQISDRAPACPHCGCPNDNVRQPEPVDFRAQFPQPGLMPFIPGAGNFTTSARKLGNRFVQIGNIEGRTLDEIIAVVGEPSSRSAQPFEQVLCQWMLPPLHAALIFDFNGVCGGFTHFSQTRDNHFTF